MPSRRTAIAFLLGLVLGAAPAGAEVFLSQQEALALAFPDAERVESPTVILDDDHRRSHG